MDFLNQLYSNDNFGIILFAFISILVLAFLIVLFFGKKDQKERRLMETNNNNDNPFNINSEVAFGQNAPGTMLEINPSNANYNNNMSWKQMENTIAVPINNMAQQQINPQNEIGHMPQPPKTDFDFDALAASISKELESIGVDTNDESSAFDENKTLVNIPPIPLNESTPIIEEPVIPPVMNQNPVVFNSPIQEQPIQVSPIPPQSQEPLIRETPISPIEEKMPLPNPSQFSSVYVNKKMESGSVLEEPKVIELPSSKPMEMPKTIDLPKLNVETSSAATINPEANKNLKDLPSLESTHSAYPNNIENRM